MSADSTAPAQPTSMQLDSRQRAMLEAMGVHVWQPLPEPSPEPSAKPPPQTNGGFTAAKSVAAVPLPSSSSNASTTDAPHSPVMPSVAISVATHTAAPIAASPRSAPAVALRPRPEGIDGMDWQQLQTAVSTCQACALCEGRKNTVFGIGQASTEPAMAPRADWLIVGEAPGENEDISGEPFVGQAGQLLDNMLRAMVINGQPLTRHSNVFIANVLKCRPPANRNPSSEELAQCQPYLQRQIALLQPKIILAMGRFAVQALLGSTEPLGKLRGRVHTLGDGAVQTPVIVTYHPAYLLRNLPDKAKAWDDLLLAMETLEAQTASR